MLACFLPLFETKTSPRVSGALERAHWRSCQAHLLVSKAKVGGSSFGQLARPRGPAAAPYSAAPASPLAASIERSAGWPRSKTRQLTVESSRAARRVSLELARRPRPCEPPVAAWPPEGAGAAAMLVSAKRRACQASSVGVCAPSAAVVVVVDVVIFSGYTSALFRRQAAATPPTRLVLRLTAAPMRPSRLDSFAPLLLLLLLLAGSPSLASRPASPPAH